MTEKSQLNQALQEEALSVIKYKKPDTVWVNPVNLCEMADIVEEALNSININAIEREKLSRHISAVFSLMDEQGCRQAVKEVVIASFKKLEQS